MSDKLKAVISYLLDIKKLDNVTMKKLQKMLYYSYAWNLVFAADCEDDFDFDYVRLFPEKFEAWFHGPSIPEVKNHYHNIKGAVIKNSGFDIDIEEFLNQDEIDIIDEVIEKYNEFNGNELEDMTQDEDPWIEARGSLKPFEHCTEKLSDKTIFRHYSKRIRE